MAISPEMLKMAMQLFKAKQEQQKTGQQGQTAAPNAWADNIEKGSAAQNALEPFAGLIPGGPELMAFSRKGQEKLANNVRELPGYLAGAGNILQQTALGEEGNANVGQSVLGGALSGVAGGAVMGPFGMILGGLLGAGSGLNTAAQSNADFYDSKAIEDKFKMSSKTVSPSIYGDGSFVIGEDELIPIQMDEKETYVTPDLRILDSKSSDVHENMEDDVVTDVVANQSFVFSNRKELKLGDYAKEVLGYGLAKYNEDGDYEFNKVTMKDGFGDSKKKVTFSEASNILKKKYETVRDEDKTNDVFTRITNQENKQARMPFLNKLIQLHEGEDMESQELIPDQYKYGGKVKKMAGGGSPDVEDLFGEVLSDIQSMEGDNIRDYQTNQSTYNNLFKRLNIANSLGSIASGLTTGLQSTRIDPALASTNLADQMYQEMSPAVVDQMMSNNFATANSLISNVARTSPEAASMMGPRMMDSVMRSSNQIGLSALSDRLQQRRGKYKFLDKSRNYNNKERIRAQEASRGLINKKRQLMGDNFTNFLQQRSALDANQVAVNQRNTAQFNANNQQNFQNRLNATSQLGQFQNSRDYQGGLIEQMAKEFLGSRRVNESTLDTLPVPQVQQAIPNLPYTLR